MQNPQPSTPVAKCLELAAYAVRMLEKFPEFKALAPLAAQLTTVAKALEDSQSAYQTAARAILPTRVDAKFENYISDKRIRATQQKAELADGKKGGPIASQVFPDGSTPITGLQGISQVNSMIALEGRLKAVAALWPDAAGEAAAIQTLATTYKAAIDGRTLAGQAATNLRAIRDVAKQAFLTAYSEVTSRVAAEFPRDATTQDLFFDDVRGPAAADDAEPVEPEPVKPA